MEGLKNIRYQENCGMIKKLKNKIIEIDLNTSYEFKNPFWDLEVKAVFSHESGKKSQTLYGFYDGRDENGEHVWKIRWLPTLPGEWKCSINTLPVINGLGKELTIHVNEEEADKKGFLRACANEQWGLNFDNGEPFYLLGDTIYNLFGINYCGVEIESVLRHRKAQGVNYIRARMQVSPYQPDIKNNWQTRDCWPWGGVPQTPDFSRLNLEYFRAVDQVFSLMSDLDMGLEVIVEAWMMEFPFNDRNKFLAEHEELWFKYIVSRYTSYPSVYIWCPANEYEFYPVGEVKYHTEANQWLKRLAKLTREYDPYKHPIGVHNWEQKIPLYERVGNLVDIDVYLVQSDWCYELEKFDRDASLCLCLESQIGHHSPNRDKVVICDEFGYEKAEGVYTFPAHERLDHHHTRRGQWRAGFSGYPIVHGFNNTWGAHFTVEPDAVGASYLIHFYRFMTEDVKFYEMSPAGDLFHKASGREDEGTLPLCLSNNDRSVIALYFPARGECELKLSKPEEYMAYMMNPRTGEKSRASRCQSNCFTTPESNEGNEIWGDDWVLVLNMSK